MLYTWRDVNTEDFPLIDCWLDEEAVGFTGLDEGFGTYYGYWLEEPETIPGENFWVKLFCRDGVPAGVAAISLWEGVFTLSELVVAPALRGKGLGTAVLRELLAEGKEILGKPIHSAMAVIFPGNHASRRAFEKAGFVYSSTHPDGDAEYYRYERFTFRPLEKESQGEVLPGLFAILHGNMDAIAPTGKGYEEDKALWCSCIGEALEKEPRKLLVIRDGETVMGFDRPRARCYRTLAELNGHLCVIDSRRMMRLDEFMDEVRRLGVTNALYMDMGAGWNYSWYRNAADRVVTLFGLPVPWAHNWVVFQK